MITVGTFEEMLQNWSSEFVLKVLQADVLMAKSKPIGTDYEGDNFIDRLVEENSHNDIKKIHYLAVSDLHVYQCNKELSDYVVRFNWEKY